MIAGELKPVLNLRDLDAKQMSQNCENRGMPSCDPHRVTALRQQVAELQQSADDIRSERKAVATLAKGSTPDAQQARARGAELRDRLQQIEADQGPIKADLLTEALKLPNTTHSRSPVGGEDKAVTVGLFGAESASAAIAKPTRLRNRAPQDHFELAESLGLVDWDAASRCTGPKFAMLTGQGALLELAVVQYTMLHLSTLGFTPVLPPDLAHRCIVSGCGFQPRGNESNIYEVEGTDLCLAATSEIALAGMHADSVLEGPGKGIPRLYAAFSHCFRREAGAAGRASRGLYRLHQFSKVEMMIVCSSEEHEDASAALPRQMQDLSLRRQLYLRTLRDLQGDAAGVETGAAGAADGVELEDVAAAEAKRAASERVEAILGPPPTLESDAWLEALVGVQASIMESLGLRGRILDMPTRELGASAYRKFDLEAWMPGRQLGEDTDDPGAWGEVTSASNCTDYQSRRLGMRYRDPATKKLVFAHTLNGTAVAVPRVIVAMLETWQQDDGAVLIPQALRPFLGGQELLEPVDATRQGIRAAGPRN